MFTYEFEEEDIHIFHTDRDGEKSMVASIMKEDFPKFAMVVHEADRERARRQWDPYYGR